MFGMGGDSRRRSASTGSDLRYDLSVSLEQAFSGDQVEISLTVPAKCEACNGSGASKGSQPKQCGQCGGYGKVRAQQGFFTIEELVQHVLVQEKLLEILAGLVKVKVVSIKIKNYQ